ncbi:MAG: histidine kinase [Acidimicrobiales bacterium]|nr:histidine kinase [Acidimicrobiales bacterium]
MARGRLRIYLGAAPGVGKTFAMLNEGRRRSERGTDVVIGFVETHGRPHTAEQVGDLEAVPRHLVEYRGTFIEEMDLDAVLARAATVVLVDELAHTNVPGSANEKRWRDVDALLDAGCDVISTVNIQHLESLNDVVERITGIRQRETVPDDVVRTADQVELVDQTPEALRRRLAHGNVYLPDKIDTALGNYFRAGNLAALRELALLWLADKVDDGLEDYRERHGITAAWETRERVVVAVTGSPTSAGLIRRAARISQRAHGELLGIHVVGDDGLSGPPETLLDQNRKLLIDMGGDLHDVTGSDVAAAMVDFARAQNATQLVLGATHRSRVAELVRGSVVNKVLRLADGLDVHVIAQEADDERPGPERGSLPRRRPGARRSSISRRRQLAAALLGGAGVPALTAVLAHQRASFGLPTVLLLFLALVVSTASVGGTLPAVACAVLAFLAANWFFTPPYHRFTVAEREHVLALAVFLGVAAVVSWFVDTAARRATDTARARQEASALARLAATMGQDDPLPTLLEHLRSVFEQDAAAILGRAGDGWRVEAKAGAPVPSRPEDADLVEHLAPDMVLVLRGPVVAAERLAVLNAFASQLAVVLEHGRLRIEARRAHELADANALRTALLQAVSHDLRTPLASIKASATSLRQHEVTWSPEETAEFLETIDGETDRLTTLVANLLDMSRVQAGVLQPSLRPVALEEVVPAAIVSLGPRGARVDSSVTEVLPAVRADFALLERALANIIDNAARLSGDDQRVRVEAGVIGDRIDLRVIDRGPGISVDQRDLVFEPFQRLGDSRPGGVGLGLAVARGFLDAMGASIEIDDTPGGGTTVVVRLAVAT